MSYKDKYAESIERQFYDLENRIISDIIRRIKKTDEITSTADWQIGKLMQLGYSSDDIESMIKAATKKTWPEMFELYDKVIDWEYVRNKKIYEQINGAFVPYEENTYLQQLIGAAKAQTKNTLQNFTQTMGIVQQIGGQYTFFPLTDFWQKTLDGAIMDITTGAFDYNSVLKKTVATLARSGIRTIDYASGYTSRLPVAARRAVMTGVSQMTGKIADYNAEQLGTEYFEVAWHANARPSHREWQGKVWSKDELVSVCGLGKVTGLLGANCYHAYYPFIPGVSERNWTDDELAELNAKEDIKKPFAGKEYNAYEATQRQRQLETAMRAQRTKVKALEAGGADQNDVIIAKARYQGQLAEYKKFSDAMGLKPHMERVYIDGLGRMAPGRIAATGLHIQSPGSAKSFRKSLDSIRAGKAGLDKSRKEILKRVPTTGTYHDFAHGKITKHDLAYLSAAEGHEFALFRSKTKDRLFHGDSRTCDISEEQLQNLIRGGYRWVAHTHVDMGKLTPSRGDRAALKRLGQYESVIVGSNGTEIRFTQDDF